MEAHSLVEDVFDKSLTGKRRRSFELHLSRCDACRAFFAAEQEEHARWFRAMNEPEARNHLPDGFAEDFLAELKHGSSAPRKRWFLAGMFRRIAAVLAGMLLFAGLSYAAVVVVDELRGEEDAQETGGPQSPESSGTSDVSGVSGNDTSSGEAASDDGGSPSVLSVSVDQSTGGEGMTRTLATAAALSVATTISSLSASDVSRSVGFKPDAGIFKDALLWYNGAVDADGDGCLSTVAGAELRNAFHAGDADHALSRGRQDTAQGNEAAIQIVRDVVKSTVTGLNIPDAVCLKGVHSPKGDGTYQPARVYLGDVAPFVFSYDSSYTIVTRFKWFGYLGTANYAEMARFGYAWASPAGAGLRFGFHGSQTDTGKANFWVSFGGADKDMSSWFAGTNKWTNMALVMDGVNRKVTLYMENCNNGDISTSSVDYPDATASSVSTPGSAVYVLGGGVPAAPTSAVNSLIAFNGMMHHLAVWGKTMTKEEVVTAFRWPNKSVNWQLGYDDGSSNEFGGLSQEEDFVCRADAEAGFPGTMSADGRSEMNITFPFDVARALDESTYPARSQGIICKAAPTSASGRISATVNGVPLGESVVGPGGSAAFLVPNDVMQESNVLALKVVSGSVTFDTIYGGGDWQVGLCNNSCYDDGFTHAYYPEYVIGTPWKLFTRVITGKYDGTHKSIDIKFPLSAEQVNKFKWRFDVRWRRHHGTIVDMVAVNGVKAGECAFYGWDFNQTQVDIDPDLLFPGTNTITIARETTADITDPDADYDEIDYVRLQPVKMRFKGMKVIIK